MWVREYEVGKEHKTLVFMIVSTLADALRATNEYKVDALVVQGNEAGGHGGSQSPPMFNLVQAVLKGVPRDGPFIIAAGGISTGAQIAGLLTMGVDGVVLGTRFLFTDECSYPQEKKQALVEADLNATTRSMAFDEVNRTMGWPDMCDGRAIANGIITDEEKGLSLDDRLKLFDESAKKGEKDRLVIWAGIGAGLTSEVKPAAVSGLCVCFYLHSVLTFPLQEVLRGLHEETVKHLKNVSSLLA